MKEKRTSPVKSVELTSDYRPYGEEDFMNPRQREYFRRKLVAWKEDILRERKDTIHNLQETAPPDADFGDLATLSSEHSLELRTLERDRKLIKKIDDALRRIEDGSYGYCRETGKPIGVKRLEARPIASLCLEAQQRRENYQKTHREEDE